MAPGARQGAERRLSRGRDRTSRANPAGNPTATPGGRQVEQWRRELAQIEKKLAAIGAERALIEEQLGKAGASTGEEQRDKLLEKYARLHRDADKWEARWLEIGTAIEETEAARAAT